jgi:tetratricopeptide (TPR) repeat protein
MRKAVLVVILVASARVASADPDYARAATLYKQAEAEMAANQYSDAAADYAEAYDITKDPVLFFKIASADDKAGRCDLALTYYRRYLSEGNPSAEFKATTEDRIKACETGEPATTDSTVPEPGASPDPGAAATVDTGSTAPSDKPSLAGTHPGKRRGMAWITLGVGIALGTVGVVSALSAEASEKDLKDLFDVRVMGRPVEFTAANQERYDDLVAQGKRYQKVSWVAFGAAGVAFATATVLFLTSHDRAESPPPVSIDVTGDGATVGAGFRF